MNFNKKKKYNNNNLKLIRTLHYVFGNFLKAKKNSYTQMTLNFTDYNTMISIIPNHSTVQILDSEYYIL